MKKLILVLILLSSINYRGFSQRNFPLPSDNPFWTEYHWRLWTCGIQGEYGYCDNYKCQCTNPVYYKSDTIINGLSYNRLYSRGSNCSSLWAAPPPALGCPFSFDFEIPEYLFATIRQDTLNGIVYIYDYDDTDEILYDFKNIIVGLPYPRTYNNIQIPSTDTLFVVSEETILLNGENYTKWNLGLKKNGIILFPGYVSVIEGIGSTFGIVANMRFPFEYETGDEMQCFSINDIVIYPYSNYNCDKFVNLKKYNASKKIQVYPNPGETYIAVETDLIPNRENYCKILTISGMEIRGKLLKEKTTLLDISDLSNGVYIIQCFLDNTVETIKFIKK